MVRFTYHQERVYSRQVAVYVSQDCPRPSKKDFTELFYLPSRLLLSPVVRLNKKPGRTFMYFSIITEDEIPITVTVSSQRQEGLTLRKVESFDPLDFFDPTKNVEYGPR